MKGNVTSTIDNMPCLRLNGSGFHLGHIQWLKSRMKESSGRRGGGGWNGYDRTPSGKCQVLTRSSKVVDRPHVVSPMAYIRRRPDGPSGDPRGK